jgi:hypothetical protein
MHKRIVGSLLLAVTLGGILAACAVTVDERRCPRGYEREYRDRYGRLHGGHCR